uniref:MAPK kinase substrate protein n=1 Tax=Arundo donax TaxID=35708 RepID=A0A0A9GZW4_ARUDO
MAGLQRSATTFRRSGSSGLVWDERFLTEADAEVKAGDDAAAAEPQPELRHSRSVGSIGMLRRGRGGGDDKKAKQKKQKQAQKEEARSRQQVFRTKDVAPDVDPASPRVSGCILCAIFGGGSGSGKSSARRRSKPRKK